MKRNVLSAIMAAALCIGVLPAAAPQAVQAASTTSASQTFSGTLLKSGDKSLPDLTAGEIAAMLEATGQSSMPAEIYEEEPSLTAPYKAGKLKQEVLNAALARLNAIRRIAGVPSVVMDDELNERAQHGSVLMSVSAYGHYPPKPDDMDDTFYQLGYSGTSSRDREPSRQS